MDDEAWRTRLLVEERKVILYLLSPTHPHGRSKARFFARMGFAWHAAAAFRDALLEHGLRAPLVGRIETPFGRKFVLEGPLTSLMGPSRMVRSVWFDDGGRGPVKLVTAYPVEASS